MTLGQVKAAIVGSYNDIGRNHTLAFAAALSYYFVLSLFPLLIFLASIVIYLPIPNLFDEILGTMARVIPADAMGLVRRVLQDVLSHTHPKLLSIGIIGTLWSAIGGFTSMIEALDVAYDVPETRPWWRVRATSLVLTLVIGLLFVVALGFMVLGPEFGAWLAAKVGLGPQFAAAWKVLRWAVAIGFTVLGVELLYFMAPNVKNRFLSTLPGASLAVAAWIAASWGLGMYFQHFGNLNKTYGALGAAVALFMWFYWTNVMILVGAEINSELIKCCYKRSLPLKEAPEVGKVVEMPKAA